MEISACTFICHSHGIKYIIGTDAVVKKRWLFCLSSLIIATELKHWIRNDGNVGNRRNIKPFGRLNLYKRILK